MQLLHLSTADAICDSIISKHLTYKTTKLIRVVCVGNTRSPIMTIEIWKSRKVKQWIDRMGVVPIRPYADEYIYIHHRTETEVNTAINQNLICIHSLGIGIYAATDGWWHWIATHWNFVRLFFFLVSRSKCDSKRSWPILWCGNRRANTFFFSFLLHALYAQTAEAKMKCLFLLT